MSRQFTVKEGIVGSQEFTKWQIVVEYMPEKHLGFSPHRAFQVVTIEYKKVFGGRHRPDVIEIEPAAYEMRYESV